MIKVNNKPISFEMENGFAVIDREWSKGDIVDIKLPMEVRYVACDNRVKYNIGSTAITRGPLVYCAEEVDNNGLFQRFFLEDSLLVNDSYIDSFKDGIMKGINYIDIQGFEQSIKGVSETLNSTCKCNWIEVKKL